MAETFIVIGGGMIGTAAAFRLQTAGFDVILIEPGPAEHAASFGNAGHIAVEQVEPLSSAATLMAAPGQLFTLGGPLDFRLRDIAYWGPWAMRYLAASRRRVFEDGTHALEDLMSRAVEAWADLLAQAGADDLMRADGHVVLWFDPHEAGKGRRAWAKANIGSCQLRSLTQEDLAAYGALMPNRAPVEGVAFEGTARLTSPQHARNALSRAFIEAGGRRIARRADAVSAEGLVRLHDGATLEGRVLVAAGVWSRRLMEGLGIFTPLVAERGYSIQIPSVWPDHLPTAVVEGQSMVLAPHAEGLRVTSFVEFARPDSPPDPRKWRRLERQVAALGFEVPSDARRWIGCRPTLPDYRPAIGALPGGRVLYAFGHQHLGVTLSAVTAERIERLALGEAGDPRLRIQRFRD